MFFQGSLRAGVDESLLAILPNMYIYRQIDICAVSYEGKVHWKELEGNMLYKTLLQFISGQGVDG